MRASQKEAQGCLGFTIPELLISVFIIVLMTGISVIGWSSGETALALDRAAHKLAQDLRKATELAQRAQYYDCDPGHTTGYKISGYGIYVAAATPASKYTLYVECSGNQEYNVNSDAVFQEVTLENKIQITSASPSSFSAFFVPPVPTITIQPINPENPTQAQITLSVAGNPARSKTITITTKGVITIN